MVAISLAGALLVLGAIVSLLAPRNGIRAVAAIGSQTTAYFVLLPSLVRVITSGAPIEGSSAWSYPVETIAVRIDALSAFFLLWSLPLTVLGTVYSFGYLKPYFTSGRNGGPQFALLNMTALAFLVVYSVQNVLAFMLGWESAAVAAWLLVIWDYRNQKIRFAGFNYLVSTQLGLFVLVAAFMLMYAETGSMDFRTFGIVLSKEGRLRSVVFLLLGTSFALKSAFFPLHAWLPRAHAAAPAHVSALMSGVIHKAGLFAFLRFLLLLGRPSEWMGWSVLIFGATSAVFGVIYTATQRDMKRLLGYSSTENVGIATMGFGVGCLGMTWGIPTLTTIGFAGGLLHLFNHALFKCLLFYAAGAVQRATHTVDLERLGGLLRRLPHAGWLFLLGGVAISALPPLNGFVSEFLLYSGLLSGEAPSPAAQAAFVLFAGTLAFVSAVSALSIARAFGIAFLGQPRDTSVHVTTLSPASMLLPMYVHALAIVVLGLAPGFGLSLVDRATSLFVRQPALSGIASIQQQLLPLQHIVWTFVAVALTSAAAGFALTRRARTHATWGCGYTAPSARMQYSARSFSAQFADIFRALVPEQRRERLPQGTFPVESSHIATQHADAVETRMFEVLGQGDEIVGQASQRIPEQPRYAFAAGLFALVVLIGLLLRTAR